MIKATYRAYPLLLAMLLAALLSACSTLDVSQPMPLDKAAVWVLLPAANNTETPQAGQRLNAITASLLHSEGVAHLQVYPAKNTHFLATADGQLQKTVLDWANRQHARYAVYGSVQEWRYKTGLDGEPAAGITLNIIDLKSNQVVWSGSGARTGWSRESVAGVAQKLTTKLIHNALSAATDMNHDAH